MFDPVTFVSILDYSTKSYHVFTNFETADKFYDENVFENFFVSRASYEQNGLCCPPSLGGN